MKKTRRIVASLLAATMAVSLLASCSSKKDSGASDGTKTSGEAGAGDATGSLVYAGGEFTAKFSAFFSEVVPDSDVVAQCTAALLTQDRNGAMVLKGIEGETREYNGKQYTYKGISDLVITENSDGTVYYDFTLKDGLKFDDGEPLTVETSSSPCMYFRIRPMTALLPSSHFRSRVWRLTEAVWIPSLT